MPTGDKRTFKPGIRWFYWVVFYSLFLLFMFPACARAETPTKNQPTQETGTLKAAFLGQDGGNSAGKLCSSGTKSDNVHLHLSGIRTDREPVAFRVEDHAQGGVWATPCDPVSNWFLYVKPVVNGQTEAYFKPFRDAPAGTEYTITVTYANGTTETIMIAGLRVKP